MDAGPLPLRPVTVGELLDAAVMLVRGHVAVLIPLAGVLVLAEQVLLSPVRAWAGIGPLGVWPTSAAFGRWWLLFALGAGLEALIIALLAGPAARAADSPSACGRYATTAARCGCVTRWCAAWSASPWSGPGRCCRRSPGSPASPR
jgi:hypothetical protein